MKALCQVFYSSMSITLLYKAISRTPIYCLQSMEYLLCLTFIVLIFISQHSIFIIYSLLMCFPIFWFLFTTDDYFTNL